MLECLLVLVLLATLQAVVLCLVVMAIYQAMRTQQMLLVVQVALLALVEEVEWPEVELMGA
jgi:hypothetical protein